MELLVVRFNPVPKVEDTLEFYAPSKDGRKAFVIRLKKADFADKSGNCVLDAVCQALVEGRVVHFHLGKGWKERQAVRLIQTGVAENGRALLESHVQTAMYLPRYNVVLDPLAKPEDSTVEFPKLGDQARPVSGGIGALEAFVEKAKLAAQERAAKKGGLTYVPIDPTDE